MDLAPQTMLSAPYFNPSLVDFPLGSHTWTLVLHLSPNNQNSLLEIFIGSKLCCPSLIVNQELILKRVGSTVIVNLNAEFIHSLLKDVFGQKKQWCIFQQVQILFDFFCDCLLQKIVFDGLASLSGV